MRYQRIGVAVTAGILVLAAGGRANADNCSNRTIRGAYGAQFTGFNTGKSFAEIGFFTADGRGNVTGHDIVNLDGNSINRNITGTYVVASDCTITVKLTGGTTANFFGVIVLGGTEADLNQTDPSTIVTGFIKKVKLDD